MTKKLLLYFTLLTFTSLSAFSQLPYAKILEMDASELKEKKFKYDSNKNQYTLSKTNGLNQTVNVLSAIGGAEADIKPHFEDYSIVVQKGAEEETSFINVKFYNDNTYHKILTWIAENEIDPIRTSSGKLTIEKFELEGFEIELITETISKQALTRRTAGAAKSIDESYNIYTLIIDTGIPPQSKWHTKEAEKKAKNRLKGKKESIDDLM